MFAKLSIILIGDQRVRDLAEGLLDRLPVSQDRFLFFRFGELQVRAQLPAVKIGWVSGALTVQVRAPALNRLAKLVPSRPPGP